MSVGVSTKSCGGVSGGATGTSEARELHWRCRITWRFESERLRRFAWGSEDTARAYLGGCSSIPDSLREGLVLLLEESVIHDVLTNGLHRLGDDRNLAAAG